MSTFEKASKKVCQEKSVELSSIIMDKKDLQINDLPPEMLLEIFKKLPTSELLKCRLVSRKWSSYISKLCHDIEDLVIRFEFCREEQKFIWSSQFGMYDRGPEFSLQEFNKILKKSKNPPFVRFGFGHFRKSDRHLEKFLDHFGRTIKSLEIGLHEDGRNVCIVWDILTERAPNIQKLVLFGRPNINLLKFTELFPKNLANQPTLPKLQVLGLCYAYKEYLKIVEDILNIAPNLKKIEGPWEGIEPFGNQVEVEDFEFLKNFQKIHLIKDIYITLQDINPAPQRWIKEFTRNLKLNSLTITGCFPHDLYHYDPTIEIPSRALGFILEILENSKNSLTKLNLEHIGFPTGLDWTYLKNIRSLSLAYKVFPPKWNFNFPPSCREIEIFPSLTQLHFQIYSKTIMARDIFPTLESIPLIPSVRKLCLQASNADISGFLQNFGIMCPNAIELEIGHYTRNFPEEVPQIWKSFKKLESLSLLVDIGTPWNSLQSMDAAFTGFTTAMQRRISNMRKNETLNLDTIEEIRKMPRRNPSALDLTNLRKLNLQFHVNGKRKGSTSELFESFWNGIGSLMIFKLMPNLELSFDRSFVIFLTEY